MPPHTLMAGAILALLHLAVAPFRTPGGRVRLSLCAASFLLFLQCFLGPARRRSLSSFVRYGAWVAYHGPFYLATYAAGNLYLLSSHEELHILAWGIVLLHALDPMPPMMAYYAGDYGHTWRKMNNAKSLGYMAIVFHAVYVTKTCTVMSVVFLLACVLYFTAAGRVFLPIHLSRLHNDDAPAVISGEEDSAKLHAAVSDEEDLVFSYKLFLRLLKPSDDDQLVTKARELLSHEGAEASFCTQVQRAFQVVEVQLAFLYDQCFTASNTNSMNMVDKLIDDTPMVTYCCLALFFVWPLIYGLTLTLYSRSGLFLTALVLVLDWLRGPVPFARLWASDWGKAMFAQRKTQGKTARPPFIDNLCNVISYFPVFNFNRERYWQEMIGQYSVLQDYNRGHRWKAVVAHALAFAESRWSPSMRETHYPREEEAVSLPEDLKPKLGHSLASAHDRGIGVTGGSWVLRDKVPRDVWISTLPEKNYANTILIWHIATCYLDMDPDYGHRYLLLESTSQANSSYDMATKLSKYCAYLVAFLPELLRGDARATSEAFQSVVQGTRTVLGDAVDKYEKMKTLSHVGQHSSLPTFEAGVALAKRLQGIFPIKKIEALENSKRIEALWNLLADFWVETILYIAPCDDTAKHIDMLAQGGELITHVWALLFNTGMMVRAPVSDQGGL